MDKANAHTLEEVRAVKSHALAVFERLASVVGIGITRIGAGYGLKVNLRETPADAAALPAEVGGVPVQLEVVGQPRTR